MDDLFDILIKSGGKPRKVYVMQRIKAGNKNNTVIKELKEFFKDRKYLIWMKLVLLKECVNYIVEKTIPKTQSLSQSAVELLCL